MDNFLKEEDNKLTSNLENKSVSLNQAAKILGIKPQDVSNLVKEEFLKEVTPEVFKASDVAKLTTQRALSVADEAAQVGIGIQKTISTSLKIIRFAVVSAFVVGMVYVMTVVGFVTAYSYKSTEVADWVTQKNPNILQTLLRPAGTAALQILRYTKPSAYQEVAKQVVTNPNDVLVVNRNGTITPTGPLVIPSASFLQIISNALVKNLNADLVQGKTPGTTTGNLAIIGSVLGLADNAVSTTTIADNAITLAKIADSAITTAKIADNAITDAKIAQITATDKIAGDAVQIKSGGGLTHGSGLTLLTSCSDSQVLQWNASSSSWNCSTPAGLNGAGITAIRLGGANVVSIPTTLNFATNDFSVSESPVGVQRFTGLH